MHYIFPSNFGFVIFFWRWGKGEGGGLFSFFFFRKRIVFVMLCVMRIKKIQILVEEVIFCQVFQREM